MQEYKCRRCALIAVSPDRLRGHNGGCGKNIQHVITREGELRRSKHQDANRGIIASGATPYTAPRLHDLLANRTMESGCRDRPRELLIRANENFPAILTRDRYEQILAESGPRI
jgi:hypothetical protein